MRRLTPILLLLTGLLLAFAVYAPGLTGMFVFDDSINILSNYAFYFTTFDFSTFKAATLSGTAGIFGRPISMASLALDAWRSDMDAPAFKLTNLLIHLLNGVAVYALTQLLMRAQRVRHPDALPDPRINWISLAVALIWLVHPLNLTSVLYVVQRMTSLAALFSLLGLIAYVYGRLRTTRAHDLRGWLAVAASFAVFTPLAALSKENGAMLPAFLLLTEVVFFRFQCGSPAARRYLQASYALTIVLPAIALAIYTAAYPGWVTNPYQIRTFSMAERLLSETRILWLYIRLAAAPDMTVLGLYHDDFIKSVSLLSPITTLVSSAALLMLAGSALALWRRQPVYAYGVLFFLLGHSMESTFLALELVHEHRNYFPLIGLLLPVLYYLFTAQGKFNTGARVATATGIVLLFAGITLIRAQQWGEPVTMLVKEVEHHPGSVRARLALANFYAATPANSQGEADMLYMQAFEHYVQASEADLTDTVGLFGLLSLHMKVGKEPDPSWLPVLVKRIESNPMTATTINTLTRFEGCLASKTCTFQPETIEALLTAALSHPNLQPSYKTQLLFAWSSFLANTKNDQPGAVKAAYAAAAASPDNLSARESLTVFLVNAKRDPEAEASLTILRAMDKMNVKGPAITELSAILAKRKKNPT